MKIITFRNVYPLAVVFFLATGLWNSRLIHRNSSRATDLEKGLTELNEKTKDLDGMMKTVRFVSDKLAEIRAKEFCAGVTLGQEELLNELIEATNSAGFTVDPATIVSNACNLRMQRYPDWPRFGVTTNLKDEITTTNVHTRRIRL